MWKDAKAVIFDLDGTLVDSMWIWKSVDIDFFGERGVELPDDLQGALDGMSFRETAAYMKNRFGFVETVDELMVIWNEMAHKKYQYEAPLKEGVLEFLKALKEKDIKVGIASSNSEFLVRTVLESHGVLEYFDSIHTANEVEKGKPAPDIYLLVAKDLQVNPEHCLIFEDIVHGIMAGKNAGMKTCAIYDHYSKEDDEKKRELADYYITDYRELLVTVHR
ncbi:MAG: HAD family phosphatase [Clostridiales bacterium]|nr:HAD family phosphatase [Clostridiales bacterium]